ncbi:hypothetical protein N7492_001189 [Penicillium capsulatum]|uniref:Uncharacterized protein n=1 Tax=Penicillium capsulatum TaxID=69766 RepID=A0A9W9ISR6_9EURO|nr:hypothetical protein N7492_001189 [Penicillium capsulatum]KAJ6129754.1 hypothetical protein N7512_002534 [Penicillium capsulatum]
MPPSTVFSYWRRDHRRSIGPSTSLPVPTGASKGPAGSPISSPPQLPELPDTPTFSDVFDETPSYETPPWSESPLESNAAKLSVQSSAAALSSVSLGIPSPSIDKENRPHSSSEEQDHDLEPEPTLTTQRNSSQLSITGPRLDQGDGESASKPTSPFRISFGKGARNLQSPATDNQRRSFTNGPGPSQLRTETSPEEPAAVKQTMPPRDTRPDAVVARRIADRDPSADQSHHKSGKAMLHLLNPMSLLARRRSSQVNASRIEDSKLGKQNLVPAIPDDYDPRIRGNIVHDFSAPRPRRNVSGSPSTGVDGSIQNAQDSFTQSGQNLTPRRSDQVKRHSDHSPVFKEHFEDDQNVLQIENKGYLQSSLLTNPAHAQPGYEKSIPVFARNLPSMLPEQTSDPRVDKIRESARVVSPEPVELPADPPRSKLPADQQHEQDIIPNLSHVPAGLPRHFKSNASRFSFDMGGVESSVQEKLLEEKHKAKEAARKMEDGYFDEFDDEFDHELMDDFDDLEEKIPGVNVDADEDDFEMSAAALKSWAAPGLSPVVGSPITPAPPEIQPSPLKSSQGPGVDQTNTSTEPNDGKLHESNYFPQSPQVQPQPPSANLAPLEASVEKSATSQPMQPILDDEDDLYFDDGEFGDLTTENPDGGFDEAIFDDETSHLYERKRVEKPTSQPSQTENREVDDAFERDVLPEEDASQGLKHMPSVASEYQAHTTKRGPLGDPIPNMGPARTHGGVLTEQNLEVLHNALAFAATESATKSRFERTFSTSNRSLGQDNISQTPYTGDSQPGLVSDDSRLSQAPDIMAFDDAYKDHIYDDDYDDGYFDDAIVAAANAEALENDDEGFYGQEFGFYAQASGNDSSELTNGGYFGPRGVEGIMRSHSSRGKFQEPSLTPITERSEWSTRNSVISLKAHGVTSNPGLSSPGLAQLVDMDNLNDEMSLSALMKLRRGAWGGSNGSLRSSAGSPPPHTLASSNRGSFIAPSEVPSTGDEGLTTMIAQHEDTPRHTASPLGYVADLPRSGIDGLATTDSEDVVPVSGVSRLNVL